MDHHCLLINNCVGARNYRHFLLAVFHLWAGCLLFLLLAIFAQDPGEPTHQAVTNEAQKDGADGLGIAGSVSNTFTMIWEALGVPAGLRGLPFRAAMCWYNAFWCYGLTTFLLLAHGQLVLANETSIEAAANAKLRNAGKSPKPSFDLGWKRNFQEVFGPGSPWSFRWLLPFLEIPSLGDHMATA